MPLPPTSQNRATIYTHAFSELYIKCKNILKLNILSGDNSSQRHESKNTPFIARHPISPNGNLRWANVSHGQEIWSKQEYLTFFHVSGRWFARTQNGNFLDLVTQNQKAGDIEASFFFGFFVNLNIDKCRHVSLWWDSLEFWTPTSLLMGTLYNSKKHLKMKNKKNKTQNEMTNK